MSRLTAVAGPRRPTLLAVGALVVLVWAALWTWGESPYARYLDHQSLDALGRPEPRLALFVLGWVVMLVAMMLPTSLPLVMLFSTMMSRRPNRGTLVTLLLVGYLGVWTLFGLVVHLGDGLIHTVVAASPWFHDHALLIGVATLLLAGVYQFTPLKYHCLQQCRSPLSFITSRWRGRAERGEALLLGVHHGLFCVGCCWTLMLIMFAVGMGNLGWMLGLGVVMAIEKNATWGRRLAAPLGGALIVLGLGLALVQPTAAAS